MVWGLTPGGRNSSVTSWVRLSGGDYAAFYSKKRVHFVARVCDTIRSPDLARRLWGLHSNGQTWELVYFLHEGKSTDFPLLQLTNALGYPTDIVLGFRVPGSTPRAEVLLRTNEHQSEAISRVGLDAIRKEVDPAALKQLIDELDAKLANAPSAVREKTVRQYERNPAITRAIKQRDNYTCQLCSYPGFPKRRGNEPYCEVHHKIFKSRGGPPISTNLLVLCAMCHAKVHYGDLAGNAKAKALNLV